MTSRSSPLRSSPLWPSLAPSSTLSNISLESPYGPSVPPPSPTWSST